MFLALSSIAALLLALAIVTAVGARRIERLHPPVGAFVAVDGAPLHVVHVPAPAAASLPPVVFIHGASANLLDQMLPQRPLLEGRAELQLYDRPGHGWSARGGARNATPEGQADTLARLMDRCGVGRAIIVGHSFGGCIAAAFALAYPERTAGLIFSAAATHRWEGRRTSWYYSLTATPVVGRLFAWTLALPAGWLRLQRAVDGVFAPNATPAGYARDAAIALVLRPAAFHANAVDVEGLYSFTLRAQPRYPGIAAPTVVISGNRDTVVYEEVHSLGLARDIPGAELVWVDNLGHKPDWIAPELIAAAAEKIAGAPRDLQALARRVEARIAADRHGAGVHYDPEAPAILAPFPNPS